MKKNETLWTRVGVSGLAILVAAVMWAGLVRAPPPDENPGQPFQEILDAIAELQAEQQAIADASGEQVDEIEEKIDEIEDKLDVLQVEAIGIEAFADPGEGPGQVEAVNDALILVRVTWKGAGVSGLAAADFTIATRLVPAGECALEIDELSFFGPPEGDYALRVTPIDTFASCDWAAGSYVSSLEVSALGMTGSTLVEIVVT